MTVAEINTWAIRATASERRFVEQEARLALARMPMGMRVRIAGDALYVMHELAIVQAEFARRRTA